MQRGETTTTSLRDISESDGSSACARAATGLSRASGPVRKQRLRAASVPARTGTGTGTWTRLGLRQPGAKSDLATAQVSLSPDILPNNWRALGQLLAMRRLAKCRLAAR